MALSVGLLLLFYIGAKGGIPILDDQHVLQRLAGSEGMSWLDGFLRYISGDVGDLKRPVSYLSIYLQRGSLEQGLLPFKLFNIVLHALNGLLVFWLARRLMLIKLLPNTANVVAIGCYILWSFAPIQVSTVLYVTQRMAELSAFFTFSALILWTYFREAQGDVKQAGALFLGVGGLTALATLSKENGFLTILLVLVLDLTIYHKAPKSRVYQTWAFLVVYAGLAIFTLHILLNTDKYFVRGFSGRDFNVYERVLTESRILVEYVLKFIFPSSFQFGVINEEVVISRGLLSPISTLFCCIVWTGAIAGAWFARRKFPYLSFAVLFFLGAHSMESTVLSLELYFEHRNYVPTFSLSLLISYAIVCFIKNKAVNGKVKAIAAASSIAYFVLIVLIAKSEVSLWSKPVQQALRWYQQAPLSQRAYSHLGSTLFRFGLYKEGANFYKETHQDFPDDPTKELLWYELVCVDSSLPVPDMEEFLNKARKAKFYNQTIVLLNALLDLKEQGHCNNVTVDDLDLIADAFLINPSYKRRYRSIYVYKSRLSQYINDMPEATKSLEKAISIHWRLDIALSLAEKYLFLGKVDSAGKLIEDIERHCSGLVLSCNSNSKDIAYLHQLLKKMREKDKALL
ncbi:hypothetical protein [Hahella chejuensis]|uniref:hypothetical protein n=1 Tax=Hahella chejuensis TaxID=158327 RepID=UPI00059F9B51|nr:hypothetical protein [Hahella chejuensis]